jgi:hypothetical protein
VIMTVYGVFTSTLDKFTVGCCHTANLKLTERNALIDILVPFFNPTISRNEVNG